MNNKNYIWPFLLTVAMAITLQTEATARQNRSTVERHAFVKEQACPATGRHRLPCPGYHIDHIVPLKCGGPDVPANMQWLTITDHKAKTRREARLCIKGATS
jgi:hypothetical protein